MVEKAVSLLDLTEPGDLTLKGEEAIGEGTTDKKIPTPHMCLPKVKIIIEETFGEKKWHVTITTDLV